VAQRLSCVLVTDWSWIQIRKQPLCICKGKAVHNYPPPYLRLARSLWALGYPSFFLFVIANLSKIYCSFTKIFYSCMQFISL